MTTAICLILLGMVAGALTWLTRSRPIAEIDEHEFGDWPHVESERDETFQPEKRQ